MCGKVFCLNIKLEETPEDLAPRRPHCCARAGGGTCPTKRAASAGCPFLFSAHLHISRVSIPFFVAQLQIAHLHISRVSIPFFCWHICTSAGCPSIFFVGTFAHCTFAHQQGVHPFFLWQFCTFYICTSAGCPIPLFAHFAQESFSPASSAASTTGLFQSKSSQMARPSRPRGVSNTTTCNATELVH